jgi:hypothetical protein
MNRVHRIAPRAFALCAVSLFLHACAFIPDNWAFQEEIIDTEALTKVKRVALLDVPQPSYIWLGSPDSATAGFINPLISLAVSTHDGDAITNSAYISITTRNELEKWLEQAGKEVVLLDAKRTKPSKMLKNYDQFSHVDADAILEVAPVNVGYMPKPGFSSQLSPSVFFTYRLVSTKSGEVLIESNVTYSSFYDYQGVVKGVNLIGPEENIFEDEESAREQPEEAIRRLHIAIRGATESIVSVVTNKKPGNVVPIVKLSDVVPIVKLSDEIDLTGIFNAKIRRGRTQDYFCFNQKKSFLIELKQNGKSFKGRFLSGITGEFEGTVDDDKVKFTYYTARCANDIRGEWTLSPDGSSLEGYGWSDVKWRLQKTR